MDICVLDKQDEYATPIIRRVGCSGCVEEMKREVQKERMLSVWLDNAPAFKTSCSPSCLDELVVGRLYSEGIIDSLSQIDSLEVDVKNMKVEVALGERRASDKKIKCSHVDCRSRLGKLEPLLWSSDRVFSMMEEFALCQTSHNRTRGTHSVFLWCDCELVCVKEDIGRHNAFDKAIGYGLLFGVELSKCAIFTSGRVPSDLALKAVRSRIPLLVSKATVTDGAIEVARANNLTLLGNARNGGFDIFIDLFNV